MGLAFRDLLVFVWLSPSSWADQAADVVALTEEVSHASPGPALVYTVNASAGTMADIRDYLLCRGLFTYEHHDEVVADCAQPALARPQLARLIANARMATATPDIEPSAGYGLCA